jgi:hypothetical protein
VLRPGVPYESLDSYFLKALPQSQPAIGLEATRKLDVKGEVMRSDKVFEALHTLQNRYMLCQIASKATRKFHKPNTRIQDTTNDVLNRISDNERANVMADPANAKEAQRRAA